MDSHKPKRFRFTPEQQDLIAALHRSVCENLIALDFSDPQQDDRRIRVHAALTGKRQMLENLLTYDEDAEAAASDSLQSLAETGVQQGPSTETPEQSQLF